MTLTLGTPHAAGYDQLTQAWYGLQFTVRYIEKRGTEFQDFFCQIMERRHPSDFSRTKPAGSRGDLKCDGLLRSESSLFQVYAPDQMSIKPTLEKIDEDFAGCLPHWEGLFSKWIFVHNAYRGLPADVVRRLEELHAANDPPGVYHWGYSEILRRVRGLDLLDLRDLFGLAPTMEAWANVGMREVAEVLNDLEAAEPPSEVDLRPPPPDKIAHNALSRDAAWLLRQGMLKSGLVGKLLGRNPNPRFADEVAHKLHTQYRQMAEAGFPPDYILTKMITFVGGSGGGSPGRQNAVLAVVAHFFETCDIFERVPS